MLLIFSEGVYVCYEKETMTHDAFFGGGARLCPTPSDSARIFRDFPLGWLSFLVFLSIYCCHPCSLLWLLIAVVFKQSTCNSAVASTSQFRVAPPVRDDFLPGCTDAQMLQSLSASGVS